MRIPNSFIKHVTFPLIAHWDGLKGLAKVMAGLERSQYWSREKLAEKQFEDLKALSIHAFENTRYYKELFRKCSFDPYAMKDFGDLRKIPILTKSIIRKRLPDMMATNLKEKEIHYAETGGTTGIKMKFCRDNACLSAKEAALYRFDGWAGWEIGEKAGIIWPARGDYIGHWTRKARLKNSLYLRQIIFPAAIIDEDSISHYVETLRQEKPVMIRAFTSPMYETAKHVLSRGIRLPPIRGIVTTGEPLYEHQKEIIEKAFHTRVFNSYRSREAGPLAQECELHDGMHINAEGLYVELENVARCPDLDQQVGNIIVTDLWNYGMPLIRYDMGDLGSIDESPCPCGRGSFRIRNILGRSADTFMTPENKLVSAGALVLYLIDEAPGMLGQVQIIQDAPDHLTIKMTKDPPITAEIKGHQIRVVKRLFGEEMKVTHLEVDQIPRDKSGKYRFTICNVQKP